MRFQCDQCRKITNGEPVHTVTRSLCADCGAQWKGVALAMITGASIPVTEGWFQSTRKLRKKARGEE